MQCAPRQQQLQRCLRVSGCLYNAVMQIWYSWKLHKEKAYSLSLTHIHTHTCVHTCTCATHGKLISNAHVSV